MSDFKKNTSRQLLCTVIIINKFYLYIYIFKVKFSLISRSDVDVDSSKAREQLTSSDKREHPRLISSLPYTAQTVPILSYKNRIEPLAYAKKTYANTHLTPL